MNPYLTGVGNFDYNGILQRLEGVWIAYSPSEESTDSFITAVGGGAFISRHQWTPDLFHPCFWLFRQSDTLYVLIAGTDIIGSLGAHLWGDVAGYFFTSPLLYGTVNYHTYFFSPAQTIAGVITNALAGPSSDNITKISISGHSYGGAVSQIAAKILQDQQSARSVECLAFGSPKPALITPSFSHPSATWSIGMPRDPAIYMPPSAGTSAWLGTENPVYSWFGLQGADWSHLGKAGEISGSGINQIVPTMNAWRIPPTNFVFSDHGIASYRDQLLIARRADLSLDGPDSFENWIRGAPQPAVPLDPGPPPSQRVQLNASDINLTSFDSPPNEVVLTQGIVSDTFSVSTSINVVQAGSSDNIGVSTVANFYKFTFLPGEANLGDSISQILSSSGTLSDAQLSQAAQNWMDKFCAMLSNPYANQPNSESAGYPLILGYRVTDLQTKNQAQIKIGPFVGSSRPPVWTVAASTVQADYGSNTFNNGILLKLRSRFAVTGPPAVTYNRVTQFFVPSTPDPLVKSGKYDSSGVASGGVSWAQRAENFGQYLANSTDLWGHMGIDPSIPLRVGTIAQFVNGQWQLYIDNVTGYAVGDLIQILTANARGWNGIYRIIGITPATGSVPAIIRIATQKPETFPPFTSCQARLYRKQGQPPTLVFWRYVLDATNTTALFPPVRPTGRKPARKFVPVSFRRKTRLPKTSR